ncbi:protein kinase domain-containing protein [Melittangium boletus]|uniref:protein kinase domain-containing protein n=1 Tax=Melittangium boletus TaxID=83453 RepID=UPI003DA45AA1
MLDSGTLVLDDRFRVLKLLGAGGMGEVYLGEQVSLGRKVAIKVLHSDLMVHPSMIERFKREARLLSAVDHPSVVRVIDYGETGVGACLVMEYVEGDNLYDVLQSGALSPMRALPLLYQLAEGLAAIHDRGIIHRDLKPENVLLTRSTRGEQARLLDFGIARLVEPDKNGNLSQVGLVVGTPEYLSPEQAVGAPVDPRSDVYSFGVLAYRVLSGQLPFRGPGPTQYVAQHASASPLPLIEAAPTLAGHAPLVALVMQLLRKDPNQRLPHANALVDALGTLAATTAQTVSMPQALVSGAMAASASISAFTLEPAPSPPSGTVAFASPAPVPAPSPPSGTAAFGPVSLEPPVPAPAPSGRTPSQAPTRASPGRQIPEDAFSPSRASTHPSPVAMHAVAAPRVAAPPATTGSLSVKPRNLTVMLTDLRGYTERTSRQTHEQNARMLETHDRLLLPLVRDYNGRLVQKRGDALLAVFTSPTQGVLCGMAMQDRLWRHNQQCAQEERLPVRICLHTGEVLVTRDAVLGEPVEVVKAVEQVAEAGEVVFTGSVNLARTRVEGDAEPCGSVPLPGSGEGLPLFRCRRSEEGPPFGGQDEVTMRPALKDRLDQALRPVWMARDALMWSVREAAVRGGAQARAHPRRALGVGLGLCVLLGLGTTALVRRADPTYPARVLLDEGKPREALEQLPKLAPKEKPTPMARQVRARALHALSEHDAEHTELLALDPEARAELEKPLLSGLAEDFGENEVDKELRALLDSLPRDPLKKHFEDLAEQAPSPRQWGALRYLEASQATDGLNLVALYAQALQSPNCGTRGRSARRLAGLGDPSVVPALQALSQQPRDKALNRGRNCGQEEAREALETLTKQK